MNKRFSLVYRDIVMANAKKKLLFLLFNYFLTFSFGIERETCLLLVHLL